MSEWIKISELLPGDAQLVLFRLKDRPETEKGIHLAGCRTFETEYCCEWYHYEDVTHWMPLPAAPEAE